MKNLNEIVITDIADAFVVTAESGKHITMKNRKWYGLSFCKSGKITYTHNHRKTVSTPDVAVFLPMHESYELYNHESGEFPLINFYCQSNDFTAEFISIPIHDVQIYLTDFEIIQRCMLNKEKRLQAISSLYRILYSLSFEKQDSVGIAGEIKTYINNNIGNSELSNESIAKEMGISEVYLRKLFKEKLNITPKQYILLMRLEQAKQSLSQTGESITDIAEKCGFSNVYHFCRMFKERTGYTPLNYRKTHRFIGI